MSDPLSIIAGVAGVATAGVSLVGVLYDTIDTYRNAPKEIRSMARGIQDLSLVLDQLKKVLIDGRELHTRRLLGSIALAVRHVENVHEDIWDIIERGDSGFARVKWAFRKTKMKGLTSKIEAHKGTLQLVCTTLLLAIQQKRVAKCRAKEEDRRAAEKHARARLRRQAENLVKAAHESLVDLAQSSIMDNAQDPPPRLAETAHAPPSQHPSRARSPSITEQSTTTSVIHIQDEDQDSSTSDIEIPSRRNSDDMALWVYNMVFSRTANKAAQDSNSNLQPDDSNALVLRDPHGSDIVVAERPIAARVVDDLLYDWTHLNWHDIKETSEIISLNQNEDNIRSNGKPEIESDTNEEDRHKPRLIAYPSKGKSTENLRSRSSSGNYARTSLVVRNSPTDQTMTSIRKERYGQKHNNNRGEEPKRDLHEFSPTRAKRASESRFPRRDNEEGYADSWNPRVQKRRSRDRSLDFERRRESTPGRFDSRSRSPLEYNRRRYSSPYSSDASESEGEAEKPTKPSRLQMAAKASLVAGALEMGRTKGNPGDQRMAQVFTAAALAALKQDREYRKDRKLEERD
ncbi:hypothetical protein FALBO_16528 [Fusarium albosuccineum]|uniref:Azaphilone pigments biosynthesis cluster protein L N-terminal domain-containing protein n=1 Tax=Fusarium albosuccineum TaxID=1237068 RepID=A0A8H4KFB5_9HYPO|nr:hypothetical protein FALBO_16528 [Fusarium albosuccineum]